VPPRVSQRRVAAHLRRRGLVTSEQLSEAFAERHRTGGDIAQIVMAHGWAEAAQVYPVLAELWSIPFIELEDHERHDALAQQLGLERVLRTRVLPIQRLEDGLIACAVDTPPGEDALRTLRLVFPEEAFAFYLVRPVAIDEAVRTTFSDRLLQAATFALSRRAPDESAITVFTRAQYLVFAALVLVFLVALYFFPLATVVGVAIAANIAFFVSVAFKVWVSLAGAQIEYFQPVTDDEVAALSDDDLPIYTVLLPVYKEANIVALLIDNLSKLDYPKDKLEILVLLEEDDEATVQALKDANPPSYVHPLIIPDGPPKTKPKACNVGLYFARGEYCVIYDAEDQPEPDQIKKALIAFRKGDPRLVCVQGQLNYFNVTDNFLTRMFTLEYSYWFDYLLPGLFRLGLVIPLGGTSNHFRTDRLRMLGAWDPFNVTEDADLGVRASVRDYTIGVINSTTLEEANRSLGNWIRQRSRWIKGYMQTALVHTRHPTALVEKIGLKKAAGFLLLVAGTPLTFLLAPLMWIPFIFWLAFGTETVDLYFPVWAVYLSAFNLLLGNGLAIYLNMLAVFRRGMYGLVGWALLNPIYWLCHSYASYKALVQLFTKPFYWEKTIHGLTDSPHSTPPA
jgi:cellulose synthase/poly-beta-1,6-N-acetylglucosamine synthase-like glycosyltransferase